MKDDRTYRGRRLRRIEWGLWRDVDRPGHYLLDYRPAGRAGPQIRRWAYCDGSDLTEQDLRDHCRAARARISSSRLGLGTADAVDARWARDAYLDDLRRRHRSEAHITEVTRTLDTVLHDIRPAAIGDLTYAHLTAWLADRGAGGLAARTLNKDRAHLSGWLEWAVRCGYVGENPVARIEPARQPRRFARFPAPTDMLRLIRASDPYDAAVWTLLGLTGLRMGSFLSLDGACFGRGGIRVPKTKRGQEWFIAYDDGCPLWCPELGEVGRRLWAARRPTTSYVRFHLDSAVEAADVERFTPHGFRHGFCSWLLMMGESLSDVQAWAHHASQSTTEIYAHLRPRGRARSDSNRRRVVTMCARALQRSLELSPP